MRLEDLVKKFIISSCIAATLIYNTPVRAENIEPYLQQKIIQLEKEDKKIEALKTQYFLEEITKLKKEYNKKYLNEVKQNKDFSWDTTEKILAGTYCVLSAMDCYQTANIPKEERKKDYKFIKSYETENPLIISLFSNRPSDGEMFLYYTLTTPIWLKTCDLVPKYITSKFIPERYNKYTRKLMLSLGNIWCLNYVINNERVTGGIIFKF